MILPLKLQVANSLLMTSKFTHNLAVDLVTECSNYLIVNDIPRPVFDFSINMLSCSVMMGDSVGNLILKLYFYIINNI
jgi:hypothetical protein